MRLLSTLIFIFLSSGHALWAEAIRYDIVKDQSNVGFLYQFGANTVMGAFPKYITDIVIDFENPANSHVKVSLNTVTAKAGFAFATQALRSKNVLDAQTYSNIEFISEHIRPDGNMIVIEGLVTVRGITKPLTLNAQLLRAPGTLPNERDNLKMRINGTLNRHDFGASGYPNNVGEMLGIKIDVQIKRKP